MVIMQTSLHGIFLPVFNVTNSSVEHLREDYHGATIGVNAARLVVMDALVIPDQAGHGASWSSAAVSLTLGPFSWMAFQNYNFKTGGTKVPNFALGFPLT